MRKTEGAVPTHACFYQDLIAHFCFPGGWEMKNACAEIIFGAVVVVSVAD